ncbi:ABC transporter substrate-binding protein [Kribbella swartbergensis]
MGGAVLSACSFLETDPAKKGRGTPPAGANLKGAKESPMLAERVKAGKLPPLEQRIPKNPMVVKPLTEPGVYGGTLQRAQVDRNFSSNQYMTWAGLVEWTATVPAEVGPGLAHKWEVLDDGRTYVFHLREGLKWSDGHPFTTDDLMYTYNDIYLNKEINPVFPTWLTSGGKPVKFVQVDELTIRFEFETPHSLLLKFLCFMGTANSLLHPSHYMRKVHPNHAEKAALQAEMKKAKVTTWQDLYDQRRNIWTNADYPVLGPWMMERPVAGGTAATIVRNPYYWKVDEQGRQLPYIDRAVFTILPAEPLGLRAANGQIDLATWDIPSAVIPQLMQNEESKPYKVLRWTPDGLFSSVNLNQSHPDPVLRALFGKIDFRAGLSHAINRDEINQALLAGQGRIQHPCAQPEDPYFEEGMGQRFIEFDVAKANEYLDKAGLTARDGKGMRLRPDGKPMKLIATTFQIGVGVENVDMLEYVKRHWAEVGIDMAIKNISPTLWYSSVPQGKNDILAYPPAGYLWDIDSLWYVPTNGLTYWAPRYGNWYGDPNGQFSAKPEGDIRQLQVLYDQLLQAPNEEKRLELGRQILRLHDKNVWIIGTVQPPFWPVVVSEDLANVPERGLASFRTHYEASMNLSQIFFRHPDQHA